MDAFDFEITGITPLLMHHDNIDGADVIKAWQQDPQNKGLQKKGDDRSPAWTWTHYLYVDAQNKICVPAANLASAMTKAGAMMPGAGRSSLKKTSAAGLMFPNEHFPLLVKGKEVSAKPFFDLGAPGDFAKHQALAAKHGIQLWPKRAKVGTAKHVRVRPRFDDWAIRGRVVPLLPEFEDIRVVAELFNLMCSRIGLCDWRPGSPYSPGFFGRANVKVTAAK
jgi:hypothetical protein